MNRLARAGLLAAASALLLGCASQRGMDKAGPDALSREGSGKADMPGTGLAMPSDLDGALRQAQAQRNAGDLTGALRTLSQLVLVAPDDPRVVGEYGKTLAAQGRSDDALAFLERALALKPDWTLYSAQGVAYDQKGNYAAAQAAYERALGLKPGEPSVLSNNALSHMQSGDLDGAEKLLMQAVQYGGASPRIASNLALLRSLKSSPRQSPPAPAPLAVPAPPASPVPAPVPTTDVRPAATQQAVPVIPPAKTSALVPNGEVGKAELRLPDLERGADAIPVVAKQPAPAPSTVTAGTASEIERLKSDPSVLIQVVPSDPYTGRAAAKTQTAKAPAKTPGAADGLSGAAALRPALSDWDWRLPSGVHH